MRIEVLENEKRDAEAEATACREKIAAARKVRDHLRASEEEVRAKLQKVQEELQLVQEHVAMQEPTAERCCHFGTGMCT